MSFLLPKAAGIEKVVAMQVPHVMWACYAGAPYAMLQHISENACDKCGLEVEEEGENTEA